MESSIDILKKYFDKKTISDSFLISRQQSPFITISRETGSINEESFLKQLIENLNEKDRGREKEWVMFGKRNLEWVISDIWFNKSLEEFLPEKKIPEFQSILEQLFGIHTSIQKIVKEVSHTILKIASLGETIIVGRGGNIITKHIPGGLHLRIISSLEKKISNIQRIYKNDISKLDKLSAKKMMQEEDKDKMDYVKKNFNVDISDPLHYSLVINLSKISEEEAINIICCEISEIRKKLKR